jgi:uncharacterized membrane protein (DUF485 family)
VAGFGRKRCARVQNEQAPRLQGEQVKRRDIHEMARSHEFALLRRAHRRSGARLTALAVGGFLAYVLLSGFAPGLMNTTLSGHLTLGLALGLGQFAALAVIVRRRLVHLRTHADPLARGFRTRAHRGLPQRPQDAAHAPEAQRAGGIRAW